MARKKEEIKITVSLWSESSKSWHLLIDSNEEKTGFSNGFWFPKSQCSLKDLQNSRAKILTCPKWLFEKITKIDQTIQTSKKVSKENKKKL